MDPSEHSLKAISKDFQRDNDLINSRHEFGSLVFKALLTKFYLDLKIELLTFPINR